ncbi:FecR domain-containing protein [Amorphus sp. 3PC139-8]|uniref:FecR family protein n=1 Tax=Amorphus sp. 3PC139-8 TaxID=2735676 RepID=UPI00345D3490
MTSEKPHDIREQAIEWLLHLEDADTPDEDRRAFEEWLGRDPAHAEAFEKARRLFGESADALRENPEDTRAAIRRKGNGPLLPAVLLVCLVLAGGMFLWADGPTRLQADIVSGANESPILRLGDGSTVQLDAGSAVAEDFTTDERRIRLLKGQAYFEVAPNRARPFVVQVGDERFEAVGTAFDVNRTAGQAEITVTEGKVRVRTGDGAGVVLSPHMRTSVRDGTLGAVETVPDGMETPWRSGRLVFEDRPLTWVVGNLARHLPGKVVIANPALGDRRITGTLDLSDPHAALNDLSTAVGLRTVQAGRLLTVVY